MDKKKSRLDMSDFRKSKKRSFFHSLRLRLMKSSLINAGKKEKETLKKMTVEKLIKDKQKKTQIKEKKKKISQSERRRHFRSYLERAGVDADSKTVNKWFFISVGVVNIGILIYLLFYLLEKEIFSILFFIIIFFMIFTLGSVINYLIIRVGFLFYLDIRRYKRNTELEKVLPDYLLLTSANIRAGMPIDQALWLAVRPRFGVLAKQIEIVAKETLVGEDLIIALKSFSNKFDSVMLKRSINILIEGMAAGGDVGDLLNKISINLQEASIMKQEMAASVMTYVIFITVASIFVAPFMFGLSYQLLSIVQNIMGHIDMGSMGSSMSGVNFNINAEAVSLQNFKIFAVFCLSMTSFFSSIIVTTIRKGDYREGLTYIPVYIFTSITIFFISINMLGSVFGSIL